MIFIKKIEKKKGHEDRVIFSFLAKNRAFFRKKWENQTALMTIFFEKKPQEQCKFQKKSKNTKIHSHINVVSKEKLLKCLKKAQNYNTLTILFFRIGGVFPRVFIRNCEEIKVISYHLYGLMRHPWLSQF